MCVKKMVLEHHVTVLRDSEEFVPFEVAFEEYLVSLESSPNEVKLLKKRPLCNDLKIFWRCRYCPYGQD